MTYLSYYLIYRYGQREFVRDRMAVQKTARVQNKDLMPPNNNFMQLKHSKDPGTITCPQTASSGTVPTGVERHYLRLMAGPSAGTAK